VGTRSAGKLFVLSHASPYARLTAIRSVETSTTDQPEATCLPHPSTQ
jgi:hypothetical protein